MGESQLYSNVEIDSNVPFATLCLYTATKLVLLTALGVTIISNSTSDKNDREFSKDIFVWRPLLHVSVSSRCFPILQHCCSFFEDF